MPQGSWAVPCRIKCFSISDELDSKIFDDIDAVINTAGMDTRKPLMKQSPIEIKSQLDVNLYGVINLTKAALESFSRKGKGQIMHIGGFADGSWATPYYTVDVATRVGMYSFIESINLEIDNTDIVVQYFCPQPADTVAEKPYHDLWRRQGLGIVSKEKIANDIYKAVVAKKTVTVQGNPINRFVSTKLKHLFPGLVSQLLLRPMGRMTMKYIDALRSV